MFSLPPLSRRTRCPIKALEPVTPIKTLLNIHPARVYRRQSEIQMALAVLLPPIRARVFASNKRLRRNKVDAN